MNNCIITIKHLKDFKANNIVKNNIDINTTKLTLSSNYNKLIIKNTTFNELKNLEILELHKCNIIELEHSCFYNLNNLRILTLSDNLFKELPYGIFDDLPNLKYLYLNNCDLQVLDSDIFYKLDSLECLDLSNNNLSVLPEKIFRNLKNLKQLNLSSNKFTHLPDDIFLGLESSLKELDLNYNLYLKFLPYSIKKLKLHKYNCDNYLLKFPKSSVKKWHLKHKRLRF